MAVGACTPDVFPVREKLVVIRVRAKNLVRERPPSLAGPDVRDLASVHGDHQKGVQVIELAFAVQLDFRVGDLLSLASWRGLAAQRNAVHRRRTTEQIRLHLHPLDTAQGDRSSPDVGPGDRDVAASRA